MGDLIPFRSAPCNPTQGLALLRESKFLCSRSSTHSSSTQGCLPGRRIYEILSWEGIIQNVSRYKCTQHEGFSFFKSLMKISSFPRMLRKYFFLLNPAIYIILHLCLFPALILLKKSCVGQIRHLNLSNN